jgi:hypothetical protein
MKQDRGVLLSSLAAVGSLVAASSCCLPIGTLLLATGTAGAGAVADALRPYLMTLSLGLLALAFWQTKRAARCRRPNPLNLLVLGASTALLVLFLLFPQIVAGWLADLLPSSRPE